jgi:hypothetical protein
MLRKVRKDVQRMVTVDYLEKEVLKEKTLEDLEENELKELQEAYLVVTVPPDFEPFAEEGVQLNDEKIEEQKVEASQEFEAATEIYNNTVTGVANSIFFGTIFLILLTRKLDGKLDSSWWVVFIPIFLERGLRWLVNLHRCACGRVVGEEIVIQMSHPNTAEANTENDESAEKEQETKTEKTSEKTSKKSSNSQTSGDEESSKEAFKSKEKASQAAVVVESDVVKESSISDKPSSSEVDTKESDTGEDADEKQKIHIDEETFHAWQNAYEQAEQDAMQEQAKASSECCSLSLQLILLCLVVAKIEQSYFSDDPNDVGFSMFWILFPFFLFFGIISFMELRQGAPMISTTKHMTSKIQKTLLWKASNPRKHRRSLSLKAILKTEMMLKRPSKGLKRTTRRQRKRLQKLVWKWRQPKMENPS